MSADNGYGVCVVQGRNAENSEHYGVFHYFASADEPAQWYTAENAESVWTDPVAAILDAHRMERENYTEYGVSVAAKVLHEALKQQTETRVK